jgi:AraC family transcriptional regulator of adaptative response/methylated-DNA-[protein]-cysteine methyltransferase
MLGMTPSHFRAGGANETIHFAIGESSLGTILVASTPKGVAAILLGKDPEALIRELQDRFPKAQLVGDDRNYASVIARVVGYVEAPALGLDLPLDVRGTAFQQRVWQALMRIPPGQTLSYAQLAESIGRPSAARAVARACAQNRLAVIVPCHRIIRGDGSLGGYRWGLPRKQALLEAEREAPQARRARA